MPWGRERGWPNKAQEAAKAQQKAKKNAWDSMLEQALNAQKPTDE